MNIIDGVKYTKLKMQQPMSANPVQVVVMAHPGIIDKQIKYKNMKVSFARQLVGLGITQLLIGFLCIIFQGIAIGIFVNQRHGRYLRGLDFIGHGFWCGIMFLITGPFGIAGGMKRNRCKVITFNVLSILSAAFAALLLSIAIPGAIIYAFAQMHCDYSSSCYMTDRETTGLLMETMMAILALIEGFVAIWSSVVCCTIGACCCSCGGSCCCPPSSTETQFLMTGQLYPGQQQIVFDNQQQSGFNQQPQMFIANQPQQFLPNSQQLMFSHNQQQAIINLDPGQNVAQYIPQQLDLQAYNEEPSPYTALSPASRNEGHYTRLE